MTFLRTDELRGMRRLRVAAVVFAAACSAATIAAVPAQTQGDAGAFFLGTWKCGNVSWTFSKLNADSRWIKIVYGDPANPAGTAVLGYVGELQRYVYRDFHTDGSYADLTSPPPVQEKWDWTGPYYPVDGSGTLRGHVIYIQKGPNRYDRHFLQTVNGQDVERGGDTCYKQ